jgi:hypothetical protein
MNQLPDHIDESLEAFDPEAREGLKAALGAYGDFWLVLANGRRTYLEGGEILRVIQWGLLPSDLRELQVSVDGEERSVWQNTAYEPGWRVVYDYGDDEDSARLTFEGKARPFDRADLLTLLSPEGEEVDTFDVLADSHYGTPEEIAAAEAAWRAAGGEPDGDEG